ncbi:MAG: hypothetical protein JWL81_2798 [Verrucomicrobiales bacterium]|nr:hypothetical protein [Verrucomicrobiales bacterium]
MINFLTDSRSATGGLLRFCLLAAAVFPGLATAAGLEPCRIEIVEKSTGWPVPLVELKTTHGVKFISDNAGIVAFDLPELMGRETWLDLRSPGYSVPADGFGMRGVRFTPKPGGTHRIEVGRDIIAKRLGRLTGAGLFAESLKCGLPGGPDESGVLGSDSVQNAVYNGKMYWAWGDTSLAHYPLGVFDMTSAVTEVQPLKSFEPPLGLSFEYFRDAKNLPRGVAKMPGAGPTWLDGYTALPDKTGKDRLVATYIKVQGYLEAYESGLCLWDDKTAAFQQHRVLWKKSAETPKRSPEPGGHPARWKDPQGREWVYFGNPFPTLRCPATFEAWDDASTWEPLTPQATLTNAGGGRAVTPHTGSIAWNAHRGKWVTVFMEANGKPSDFGELWYAEAPQPTGPWGKAVKVLTHENYTFYNPRLHPEFTPDGSPILLFEGTYTAEFANRPEVTARWNYNQVLYRLDLDDPALAPAREP